MNEEVQKAAEAAPEKPAATAKPKNDFSLDRVTEILESGFDNLDLDDEAYKEMTGKSVTSIKEDELVSGKIVKVTKDEVFVDIGFKSVGIVPRAELLNAETLAVGDKIDVFIENIEDANGNVGFLGT